MDNSVRCEEGLGGEGVRRDAAQWSQDPHALEWGIMPQPDPFPYTCFTKINVAFCSTKLANILPYFHPAFLLEWLADGREEKRTG